MLNTLHMQMIKLYAGDPKRIQHFCKVHSYAKLMAEMEGVDDDTRFIIETAALTHDIGIHLCEEKYGDCSGKLQEKEGPALAKALLAELGYPERVSERVQYLIAHHHTYNNIDAIDYQILSKESVKASYDNIFRTEAGRLICREMFDLKI